MAFVFTSCTGTPTTDADATTKATTTAGQATTQPTAATTLEDGTTEAPTTEGATTEDGTTAAGTINKNDNNPTTASTISTAKSTTKPVASTTKKPTPTKKTITTQAGVIYFNNTRYRQTFYDDFEGTTLDRSKWEICPEWTRHNGNVWRKDMVSLDGKGNLVLSCAKLQGSVYKSGAVRSRDRFEQTYGYFEARCELQKSPGFWGAFWLMPNSIDNGVKGGSDGTEIDIFESAYLSSERINHAIHWDGYGSDHKSIGTNVHVPGVHTGYHTFALEWTKDAYRFYVDGKKTHEITSAQADICEVPTYLKLTVEAGTWAGQCDDSKLPDGIKVDWVKVYKKF